MPADFDARYDRKAFGSSKWLNQWNEYSPVIEGDDILSLWTADMDFRAPDAIVEKVTEAAQHGIYGYTLRTPPFFAAVRDWFAVRHGWDARQDWFIHAPGVMPAVSLILRTFTAPGDGVIVQTPVFFPYFKAVRLSGRALLANPLRLIDGRYEIDFAQFDQLAASGAKAFILCNPHNPSGRAWTRAELGQLAEICARHGVLVISDEIHCDIRLNATPHTVFAQVNEAAAASSFICTAPTKTFNLAGVPCSMIVIPNDASRARYTEASEAAFLSNSSLFARVALESAYRDGAAWLADLTEYLKGNLGVVQRVCRLEMPEILPLVPDASFLVWLDARQLERRVGDVHRFLLERARVNLYNGRNFGPGGEGFLRLNIACPQSLLLEALNRIRQVVRTEA